jgi:long-chain acyl-CoA synthetase
MGLNLGTILHASAVAAPDKTAIRFLDTEIRYGELETAVRALAARLLENGLQPGDRVALFIPNVPEYTICYFAILYAGGAVVPINVLAAAPEVTYFLNDSGARLLLAHSSFAEAAKAGAAEAGAQLVIADRSDAESEFSSWLAGPGSEALAATGADDTAVILYTSGTTGRPKGAELSHSNLFINCAVVLPRLLPGLGSDATAMAALPLFHSFGQTCIQNGMLAAGGSFSLVPRFEPGVAFEILQRDRINIFAGVPTMYIALLEYGRDRDYDLSGLKYCLTGGAPMPVEVLKAFEEKYNVPILEGFGLSETSPVACFNVPERERMAGSIGFPVWGVDMCIVDDEDQPLGDGERGEICIRGHNVMKGYLDRPEANAETLKGGWFHSGDIGYRDEDGRYWIVDRKKDMILRGGFNVYPREVEEVLYAHDAVLEAAVIGVPHPTHGEEVKAVIARVPGASLEADEVIAYCKENLAAYKYPRLIEFIDELPKGPTGKILKRELR